MYSLNFEDLNKINHILFIQGMNDKFKLTAFGLVAASVCANGLFYLSQSKTVKQIKSKFFDSEGGQVFSTITC